MRKTRHEIVTPWRFSINVGMEQDADTKPFSAIYHFSLATVASLFFLVLPIVAKALTPQTVVRYTFSGTTGAPTATAGSVTGSEFIRDGSTDTFYENTAGLPAPDTNSSGWSITTTLDLIVYYILPSHPAPRERAGTA